MSSTYTAWNGEERPWPPPENWYRAADGRWWHPAYGPGDEPELDSETGTEPEATPEPDSMPEPEPRLESEPASESESEPEAESEPEPEAESESESPHIAPTLVDAPNRPPFRRPLVTAALIAAVVLLAAAVSSIVVRGSTDDLATAPDKEPAAPDADDPAPPSPASGSEGEGDSTVGDFRRTMDEHGLSTEALTDRQITGFASSYCTHAAEAEDRADFDELRQRAIAAAGSELTPIQLDLTISTAVAVFCPAESDRLGLSEDASGP